MVRGAARTSRRPRPEQADEPLGSEGADCTPSDSDREEFIRSHYELIAGHATQRTDARWTYVQLSLFGVAAFYAALFSGEMSFGDSKALDVLIWLPVPFAAFGWARAWSIHKSIMDRNDLLLKIEQHHSFEGWAHIVDRRYRASLANRLDILITAYWVFLLFFSILSAIVFNFNFVCLRSQGCT